VHPSCQTLEPMKLLLWSAFWLSIIGFILSAMLRSRSVQEYVVQLWLSVAERAARPTIQSAAELAKRMILSVYSSDRGISVPKILSLSFVVAVLTLLQISPIGSKGLPPVAWSVTGSPLSFPSGPVLLFIGQFALEACIAVPIVLIIRKYPQLSLLPLLLATLASVAIGVGVTLGASTLVSELVPSLFANTNSLFWFSVLPLVPNIAFWRSVVDAFSGEYAQIGPLAYSLTAACIWYLGVLCIFASSVCFTSRSALAAVAGVLDRVNPTFVQRLHHLSLLVFTLATGSMQAYGF
jgi:hypothetical protein